MRFAGVIFGGLVGLLGGCRPGGGNDGMEPVWRVRLAERIALDVAPLEDGGAVAVGLRLENCCIDYDTRPWVTRVDASGEIRWTQFGDAGRWRRASAAGDRIYLLGTVAPIFAETFTPTLRALRPDGTVDWSVEASASATDIKARREGVDLLRVEELDEQVPSDARRFNVTVQRFDTRGRPTDAFALGGDPLPLLGGGAARLFDAGAALVVGDEDTAASEGVRVLLFDGDGAPIDEHRVRLGENLERTVVDVARSDTSVAVLWSGPPFGRETRTGIVVRGTSSWQQTFEWVPHPKRDSDPAMPWVHPGRLAWSGGGELVGMSRGNPIPSDVSYPDTDVVIFQRWGRDGASLERRVHRFGSDVRPTEEAERDGGRPPTALGVALATSAAGGFAVGRTDEGSWLWHFPR